MGFNTERFANKVSNEKKSAKKLHFDEKIIFHDRDPRKMWKTLFALLGTSSKSPSKI